MKPSGAFTKRALSVRCSARRVLALALSLGLAAPASAETQGVWLTNSPSPLYYDRARIREAMEQLQAAGFNRVLPNVWSRGTTFHRSAYAPVEAPLTEAGLTVDPICTLVEEGRQRGIQVMPWFEYGLMEPVDSELVRNHPEWVLARADGQRWMLLHGRHRMAWLNPAHPAVRERFIGLVVETLRRCPMQGLQLDDHFAWPVQFGYDPFTVDLYQQTTGGPPPQDHTNHHWMSWRRRQLTGLLRELRLRLKQEGLSARISLSPGPFRQAYNLWLQDWKLWAFGELIDELVVQNYAYSVEGFQRDLDQPALRKAREWRMPIQIGILAGFGKRTTPMQDLREKVRLARERGFGVIFFYWEGLWGSHVPEDEREDRYKSFVKLGS